MSETPTRNSSVVIYGDQIIPKLVIENTITPTFTTSSSFRTDSYQPTRSSTRDDKEDVYEGDVDEEDGAFDDEDEEEEGSSYQRQTNKKPVVLEKLVDKIPKVKPNVDYQDKLWTQIDILDDVKKMSEEVSVNEGSFFNKSHSESLKELRDSQLEVLRLIKLNSKILDENIDHNKIWEEYSSNNLEDFRKELFNREYFQKIHKSLETVDEGLDKVTASMRELDKLDK